MKRPTLKAENVETLLQNRFVSVTDLKYEGVKHYYNVSRRAPKDIIALKSDEEFKELLPDAVTCMVIVRVRGGEPRLLMTKEFRYPTGQFLLSPPAGLMDPSDREEPVPQIATAIREIREETGLALKETDRVFIVSPFLFSTPGLTDECNAIVCAVADINDESVFNADGEEGTEVIGDYTLLSKEDARCILKQGRDDEGIFYSVYTCFELLYFMSGLWEKEL